MTKIRISKKTNKLLDEIYENRVENIFHLLDEGADAMELDGLVLRESASRLDLKTFKSLLEYVSDKEIDYNRLMLIAAVSDKLDIFDFLVNTNAYIHYDNDMALKGAAEEGCLEIVKYIIEQVEDPTLICNEALVSSSYTNQIEVTMYLIEKGGDIEIPKKHGQEAIKNYIKSWELNNTLNEKLIYKRNNSKNKI